jgi:hypothetical protein
MAVDRIVGDPPRFFNPGRASTQIPQTDLVTEVTEYKQEFTEKELGIWTWKIRIHPAGETLDCIYSDATDRKSVV